ncbi:MAG: protein-disulfide reductase DsbD N-terminal domain-containing protein [Chitinophagaceae bacterium]|jgi:thiol:disulfide interchange protein DsbD|nr:protein-disulfide reductase DsbD N-terminal domain-containing protein [Chitinophagaceae bacterium]
MKKIILTALFAASAVIAFSQTQNPVTWSYAAVKKTGNEYQIVLTATVAKPWHIYSQNMQDGGPVPTKITFAKNPLVTLQGKTIEKGNMKSMRDKNFDNMEVKYYSDKVEFVQTITAKAKTNVSGTIDYMVCDDRQCLPPTTKNFSVKL